MEKLLFSRSSSAPAAPAVGSYEGQNLFALNDQSSGVIATESTNITITDDTSSAFSPVDGAFINRNSSGNFQSYSRFDPLSCRKILRTNDTSAEGSIIWTLPDVSKKAYTLGVGRKPPQIGYTWFCPDQYPSTSLIKDISVQNLSSDSDKATYRVAASGYRGDLTPTADNLSFSTSYITTGILPSRIGAPPVNRSTGESIPLAVENPDPTMKQTDIEIVLSQASALDSILVRKKAGNPMSELKVGPSTSETFQVTLENSNSYSAMSGGSIEEMNYSFSSHGDVIYNISPTSSSEYPFSVLKSYKAQSYAKHADETASLTEDMTLYSSPTSSHAFVYIEGANPNKTGCPKVNDSNYNRVKFQIGIESHAAWISLNLFAYEGEEWFDFPVQEWRKGTKVWACIATYDSNNKISSVGEVFEITEHPLNNTLSFVGEVIQAGLKSGHNRNQKSYPSAQSYGDLGNSYIVSSDIYRREYYTGQQYYKDGTFPTFQAADITPGEIIYKNHVKEMLAISEDLRGGAGCSDCSGNCYESCDTSCFNSCDTICSTACGMNCGDTCDATCGINCTSQCSGNCSTTCYSACSSTCKTDCTSGCYSGCSTTCYSGCSNKCWGGCADGCSTSCAVSCGSSCGSSCQSSCTGGCYNGCSGTCSGGCGRCSSSCWTECARNDTGCGIWGCSSTCGDGACSEGCYGGCSGGAGGSCSCGGNCTGSCTYGCSSCTAGCSGSCNNTCSANCLGDCKGTCGNSCSGNCGNDCSGKCTNTCSGTCSNTCTGTCSDSCNSGCASTCQEGCSSCSFSCTESCLNDCQTTCLSHCGGNCLDFCSVGCSLSASITPIVK